MSDAADDQTDAPDLAHLSAAAERLATPTRAPASDSQRDAVLRALPGVLATILGVLVVAALAALTGAVSLGVAPLLVGAVAAAAAAAGLVQLTLRQGRRERAARELHRSERAELVTAVGGAIAHVERLDSERAGLNRRIAGLERRIAGKDRQLARLQAFDAERRTLEPAPSEPPAEQLTLEAMLAGVGAEEAPARGDAAAGAATTDDQSSERD